MKFYNNQIHFIYSPKNKYIRITKDENFSHDKNYLSNTPALADSVCSYDLDQCDEAWLKEFNGERSLCGLPNVNEEQFERIVEELEVNTKHTKFYPKKIETNINIFRLDVMIKFKQ